MQEKTKEQTRFSYHPELGGLEVVDARYYHKNFSRHSHEGYTINVIDKGVQKFYYAGCEHFAPEHSIIFVNADEIHNGQSATDSGWSYHGMSPLESQFNKLAADLGLGHNFAPYFPNAVVNDPCLAGQMRQMFSQLAESDNSLLRETLVYGVMSQLMIKYGKRAIDIRDYRQDHSGLSRVQAFIHEHLSENINLETLALLAGNSPFHLLRQFQKKFGLPPHAYQVQQRLQRGKALLRQGLKVAEVASEVGFHDQSHFHRHFKKAMGFTPGYYAREVACGK
ncbi:AraC family transcriptional regulator [Thalassomonas haliotis]|uniref:AraC family transcriptional regulator n=1 Tax=Thalassomonas haliotis TaxID=485448 RepID=A0ABY7VEZ8_9GAMM|nr:AraC family transcriptional regulator [Thalassomonas haliotis]WDE12151.1 AraC family transcriptional regulator [Thalassomonas haliotis]